MASCSGTGGPIDVSIVPGVRHGGRDGLLLYGFLINLATVTGLDRLYYYIVSRAAQSTELASIGINPRAFRVIRRNHPYHEFTHEIAFPLKAQQTVTSLVISYSIMSSMTSEYDRNPVIVSATSRRLRALAPSHVIAFARNHSTLSLACS